MEIISEENHKKIFYTLLYVATMKGANLEIRNEYSLFTLANYFRSDNYDRHTQLE